jgi:hypothetical protein
MENVISKRFSASVGLVAAISAGLLFLLPLFGAQQSDTVAGQATSNGSGTTATIPAGTRMMVRMVDPVDSERNQANDRFRGSLDANLMADNVVVAPKGTTVFGRLITAESAGRSGGQLEIDLTDIVINGQTYSLTTSSKQAQGETNSGGTGTGAKAGGAVGAVASGVGGAIRGAATGAVAGRASGGSTTGEKVSVPAGALVEFTLRNPVSLPVAAK